jgi:CheY-like chemotaxis protein
VDENEQRLSTRAFVLETSGHYRVLRAASSAAGLDLLESSAPYSLRLLICDLLLPAVDELLLRSKVMHPALPRLLVSSMVSDYGQSDKADGFLSSRSGCAADFLAKVRAMCVSKRGPKPSGFMKAGMALSAGAPRIRPRGKARPGRLKGDDLGELRRTCYERDGGRCVMCGVQVSLFLPRTADGSYHMMHKQAKRRGGDSLENVATGCGRCHRSLHAGGKPVPAKVKVEEERVAA